MKSSAALAQVMTSFRYTLTVKAGPDRGRSYQLLPPKVTIGRDNGNDIVLNDPKVSRTQATIEFHSNHISIIDHSSHGSLSINDLPVDNTHLSNGDVIQIGETVLVFRMDTMASPPAIAGNLNRGLTPPAADPYKYKLGGAADPSAGRPSRRSSADNGRLRFYIMVLFIGGLLAWLLMDSPKKDKPDTSLRSLEEIEAEIKGSEDRKQVFQRGRQFANESEKRRYEEAQSHYLQGFRDYQKGNYARAMKSFETARAIDPTHDLSKRYYTLAARARDEFVVRHILEGKKYKERLMYSRCISSLNMALKALGENAASDIKGKEAIAIRDECETLQEGRF